MLRTILIMTIGLAVVGTFMALDKTVGHWYVPEVQRALTSEDVARDLLGGWERSLPLEAPEITGKISEPPPGSLPQLRYALRHFANVAAIILLRDTVRGLSDQAIARRYQECEAYLMGRNANASSCNLRPLGEPSPSR